MQEPNIENMSTQLTPGGESGGARQPERQLTRIEIDLIFQDIATPAVNHQSKSSLRTREVATLKNQNKQYLVNYEENKKNYRFGSSK
jgi:hypothetical protein